MKDKKDIRGRADLNNDGITGYTQGANQRSNWITENLGKTIIIIVGVVLIVFIYSILTADNGPGQPDSQGSQQQQAGQ